MEETVWLQGCWLESFGLVENVVFYVFCAVGGVIALLSLVNILVSCCIKSGPSSSIDFNISIGCMLLVTSVLFHGVDTSWTDWNAFQILCELHPMILLVGATQFFGGLFVKSWTVFLYYRYTYDKRPLSEEWKANLWIWILLIIICIITILWIALYTPELETVELMTGVNAGPVYSCHGEFDLEWKVATAAWHGFLLILSLVAVPVNCAVSRGHDTNMLSVAVVNSFLSVLAGILVFFIGRKQELVITETVQYAIYGGLTLWMTLVANIIFLISKFLENRDYDDDDFDGEDYDSIKDGTEG